MSSIAEPCLNSDIQTPKEECVITFGISEEIAATAFLIAKEQGLLPWVFYEAPNITLSKFLAWHTNPNNVVYGCYVRYPAGGNDLAGLGWAVSRTPVGKQFKFEVGFLFFKQFQRTGLPERFASLMIGHAFENLNAVLLCGTTPTKNIAAARFIQKTGFKTLGVMPHFCTFNAEPCNCVLSYYTREMWEQNTGRA